MSQIRFSDKTVKPETLDEYLRELLDVNANVDNMCRFLNGWGSKKFLNFFEKHFFFEFFDFSNPLPHTHDPYSTNLSPNPRETRNLPPPDNCYPKRPNHKIIRYDSLFSDQSKDLDKKFFNTTDHEVYKTKAEKKLLMDFKDILNEFRKIDEGFEESPVYEGVEDEVDNDDDINDPIDYGGSGNRDLDGSVQTETVTTSIIEPCDDEDLCKPNLADANLNLNKKDQVSSSSSSSPPTDTTRKYHHPTHDNLTPSNTKLVKNRKLENNEDLVTTKILVVNSKDPLLHGKDSHKSKATTSKTTIFTTNEVEGGVEIPDTKTVTGTEFMQIDLTGVSDKSEGGGSDIVRYCCYLMFLVFFFVM